MINFTFLFLGDSKPAPAKSSAPAKSAAPAKSSGKSSGSVSAPAGSTGALVAQVAASCAGQQLAEKTGTAFCFKENNQSINLLVASQERSPRPTF